METEVRLTKLAGCAGCGAKVGAGTLVSLLEGFRTRTDPNLIVGFDKSDDASVYRLNDELALVQTTDFFPPVVDDPFVYGQIAAANALSDVYAMGGEPKLALNLMCIPEQMDAHTVQEILRGGYEKAYEAGAIISGAYFGDKLSPLSDTTILASSSTGTDLFVHIKYMFFTTIPSMTLTLIIFLAAGFFFVEAATVDVRGFSEGLSRAFHVTPWTLLVPLATGILIALRLPSLAVLFISALLGGVSAVIWQSDVLLSVAGEKLPSAVGYYKALVTTFFSSTHIATGNEVLDRLVSTRGMSGMLTTVWLILCAVSFGGVMYAGGMLRTIADVALAGVRGIADLVGATALTGALMNVAAGDQYISILITADMFRDAYRGKGLESRLLSRTIEDSSTVTSVLIPWNTCAMAQSASLGISTVVYLPFCFFNLISPFMSVIVAAIGWKIVRPHGAHATTASLSRRNTFS